MNMQREVPVSYHSVPLTVVGIFEPAEDSLAAQLIIQHVRAGGVDIFPMLTRVMEDALEELALRVIEEGR
jgi:hypothetical protein